MLETECRRGCDDGLDEITMWMAEESSIYWADHVAPAIDLAGERRPSIRRLHINTGERCNWGNDESPRTGDPMTNGVEGRWPRAHSTLLRPGRLEPPIRLARVVFAFCTHLRGAHMSVQKSPNCARRCGLATRKKPSHSRWAACKSRRIP